LAKTFVQLGILLAWLSGMVAMTTLTATDNTLTLAMGAIVVVGAGMIYLAFRKSFFDRIELLATGFASLSLGASQLLGDAIVGGISIQGAGITVAIITWVYIILMVLRQWE